MMTAQSQVNLKVFDVVLKDVLALHYYCQVFAVERVSVLYILSLLFTLVLVKV